MKLNNVIDLFNYIKLVIFVFTKLQETLFL